MLHEQTVEKLYAMKLNGMAEAFKEQLELPDVVDLSFEERFALLVDFQRKPPHETTALQCQA